MKLSNRSNDVESISNNNIGTTTTKDREKEKKKLRCKQRKCRKCANGFFFVEKSNKQNVMRHLSNILLGSKCENEYN